MEILVDRYERSNNGRATIGRLSVDGQYECFTLEDRIREIHGVPVEQWKIKGQTAIPQGRYKLTLVWSPKHACMVPLVNDVPGFSAIEIHWGNTDVDTEGCLLLGNHHNPGEDRITESNLAWDAFMLLLEQGFGVTRAAVDGRGKPLHYEQSSPAQEAWITYQNSIGGDSNPTVGSGS